MRRMGMVLAALALAAAAPLVPAIAAPRPAADVAAAVARPDRPVATIVLDASRKPVDVLGFLGLHKGDRVLDVMAGTGYYSEIVARAVGRSGRVTALEPPVFLPDERTQWNALTARVPNVTLLPVMPADASFPPASFDFVLMHLVYHDTYWSSSFYKFPEMDPDAFLRAIFAAVRPGGIVGVVDHVANPGGGTREVVEKLHRIDPAVIKADFARAGFVLEAESDVLRMPADDHSLLVFNPPVRGKTDRVVLRFRKPA